MEKVIVRAGNPYKKLVDVHWKPKLLRRYNQTLYRVIRSFLKHEEDVEDAMQDTYLKAYEKLPQFRDTAAFSTWLIRIGINEALLRIRSLTKEQKIYTHEDASSSDKIVQLPDAGRMNPEKQAIQYETRQQEKAHWQQRLDAAYQ